MKKMRKRLRRFFLFCMGLFVLWLVPNMLIRAATIYDSPYVVWTPDHSAWMTTDKLTGAKNWYELKKAQKVPDHWYPLDETRNTGILSSLPALKTGQHYYVYDRTGQIPVGYWKNVYSEAACVHKLSAVPTYGGLTLKTTVCNKSYFSGWMCYCADCGEPVNNVYMYMSRNAMASLDYIDVDVDWAFLCPSCTHLENSRNATPHECKAVSWNQYKVHYDYNVPGKTKQAEDSFHMYNNATVYEGKQITPMTRLNKNIFTRIGYTFDGWSLTPNGPKAYDDGAEIYNLTAYDWHGKYDGALGVVTLYARWVKTESSLMINPGGGTYDGSSSVTTLTKGYGSTYVADPAKLVGPYGYTVSFNTNGAGSISSKKAHAIFLCWKKSSPFYGYFAESTNKYSFEAPMGKTDTLTAVYEAQPITLPSVSRSGHVFGGWYEDAACKKPAGQAGDKYVPQKNITLYAAWSTLTLKSENNMTANNKKGAVNLSWTQPDSVNKTYAMFQSKDGVNFTQLFATDEGVNPASVTGHFPYQGGVTTYTVPYTGIYHLMAHGAQGGGYGSYVGGKGATIEGDFYFKKGDVLTVNVGGMKGWNGGGAGTAYGNGGGATTIIVNRTNILLVAGGGGGASMNGNGGAGGNQTSLSSNNWSGDSGMAGGGGGYFGGTAGAVIYHTHGDGCGYHTHNGDAVSGGACFDQENITQTYCTVTTEKGNWNISWTCDNCGNGTFACWGWKGIHSACGAAIEYTNMECICTSCGIRGADYHPEHFENIYFHDWKSHTATVHNGYLQTCTIAEGWLCGKSDTTVESSYPAYGGSSNVGSGVLNMLHIPGNREGDGAAGFYGVMLGFTESMKADGVKAPDEAKPDAIDINKVVKTPLSSSTIRVSFEKPKDNGTDYYHFVNSYATTGEMLLSSNTVKNTLTSGIKGYYYILDTTADKNVTASNAQNKSSILTGTKVDVNLTQNVQYLHLAAVDVAGNVGPTIDIQIEKAVMEWPVATGTVQITDEISGTDYGTLYVKNGVNYVRADGEAPIKLSFSSYMDGTARNNYQIDIQTFAVALNSAGTTQQYITTLPYTTPYTGSGSLPVSGFTRKSMGTTILKDASNTGASRSNKSRNNSFYQCFSIPSSYSGKTIVVTPIAGATGQEDVIYSDWTKDKQNAITLMADGAAPIVTGLEVLEGMDTINKVEDVPVLTATASDALSGVKEFYITVTNANNGALKKYTPNASGQIKIDFDSDDVLFSGDLVMNAYAKDNVGNVYEKEYEMLTVAMETQITRVLEPHTPLFRGGESGILHIVMWGYVERVEVEFPQEMLALNPNMNQTYVYTPQPYYTWEEKLQFMIPVYTPPNCKYMVTVRAYKGDKVLVSYPELSMVEDGKTILDEIRNRLR
ncbi:MAG: hypothetical protein E7287_01995 [Lachnospiraceae bacterium]|nr:hypothetical protein [Lachnospiraceae bacterium]